MEAWGWGIDPHEDGGASMTKQAAGGGEEPRTAYEVAQDALIDAALSLEAAADDFAWTREDEAASVDERVAASQALTDAAVIRGRAPGGAA